MNTNISVNIIKKAPPPPKKKVFGLTRFWISEIRIAKFHCISLKSTHSTQNRKRVYSGKVLPYSRVIGRLCLYLNHEYFCTVQNNKTLPNKGSVLIGKRRQTMSNYGIHARAVARGGFRGFS